MVDLLKDLSLTTGVSGSEEKIREFIKSKVKTKVDEVYQDSLGNLICVKKGKGEKVMLAAHMDEIGLIATFVDDNGFIRFSNIGGVSAFYSLGQRVLFENGAFGTISYDGDLEEMKNLKLSKMYIDIGEGSKEDVLKKIKIGEKACFYSEPKAQGDVFIAKAMDDRCGCAVLIDVLEKLKDTDKELYFVFTVQEEVGLRGAKTAAYGLMPDIAIAVDVTLVGDTPKAKPMDVSLGKGPAIKIKDNSVLCHKDVVSRLVKTCEKSKIPYQSEILEAGGTDIGAIHLTGGGIPSGGVSIPSRYVHSPNEMVNLKDLEMAVKLLVEFLV